MPKTRSVYIVDHCSLRPPVEWSTSPQGTLDLLSTVLEKPELQATKDRLERMPLCDCTFVPPSYHKIPLELSIESSKEEIGDVFSRAVTPFLSSLNIKGTDIDVVVTGCSTFSSVAPQSARLCNLLGCRSDVVAMNLSGTGDSLGASTVSTSASLLRDQKTPGYGLVVVSEVLSTLLYSGSDQSFIESNVTYRLGCSVILLTTRSQDKHMCKYKLVSSGGSHRSIGRDNTIERFDLDKNGQFGFWRQSDPSLYTETLADGLQKTLAQINGRISASSPHKRSGRFSLTGTSCGLPPVSHVDPQQVQHVIMQPSHPDIIQKGYDGIGLGPCTEKQESSKNAFYYYGNTGPSGLWYALGHCECVGKVKRGDTVLLLGVSGCLYVEGLVLQSLQESRSSSLPSGAWTNCTPDSAAVIDAFSNYYDGKTNRTLTLPPSQLSRLRKEAVNPTFYPYIHGVWESDMTRFKDGALDIKPIFMEMIQQGE